MIAPTSGFWKAFFDPGDRMHLKARAEIALFDREKIVLSQFVIAEVAGWLLSKGKGKQCAWFLDYAQNTANTRIYIHSKEDLAAVLRISAEESVSLERASLEYLRRALNCDITGY